MGKMVGSVLVLCEEGLRRTGLAPVSFAEPRLEVRRNMPLVLVAFRLSSVVFLGVDSGYWDTQV
jgi:hypothetical protein